MDLPQVSQKKIDLVDAVIPRQGEVSHLYKPCCNHQVPTSVHGPHSNGGAVKGLPQRIGSSECTTCEWAHWAEGRCLQLACSSRAPSSLALTWHRRPSQKPLTSKGFDPSKPTLFTCEGILCYLPQVTGPIQA